MARVETTRDVGGTAYEYRYDRDDRPRVCKIGTPEETFRAYDRGMPVYERKRSRVGSMVHTWGPTGLVSGRVLGSSERRYYVWGHRGEARAVPDQAGAVTGRTRYGLYGEVRERTGPVPSLAVGFAGRYGCREDTLTTLVRCGVR